MSAVRRNCGKKSTSRPGNNNLLGTATNIFFFSPVFVYPLGGSYRFCSLKLLLIFGLINIVSLGTVPTAFICTGMQQIMQRYSSFYEILKERH